MSELILKPSPKLVWRKLEHDEVTESGCNIDSDITALAHEYLFESITNEKNILLLDIFRLFDAAPLLNAILSREFSDELLLEARKGSSTLCKQDYLPEGIEFLELNQMWYLNTATREYNSVHRLNFRGVG